MKKVGEVKTILVDFDETLMPFGWPGKLDPPYPGVRDALRSLKEKGFKIVIFTGRAWDGWKETAGVEFYRAQLAQVYEWLSRYEIPFDKVSAIKEPAIWIIDDRALNPKDDPKFWETLPQLVSMGGDSYGKIGVGKELKIDAEG